MATSLTQEDLDFLRWLDSPRQAVYWITNDEGEKIILREGWTEAEKEYKRIKTIMNALKDVGVNYVDFDKMELKVDKEK